VASNAINPLSLRSDDVNASSIRNNNTFPIGNQTIVYINRITRSISIISLFSENGNELMIA
jgi:hypothetical protein